VDEDGMNLSPWKWLNHVEYVQFCVKMDEQFLYWKRLSLSLSLGSSTPSFHLKRELFWFVGNDKPGSEGYK
jgi:hypothetical protein